MNIAHPVVSPLPVRGQAVPLRRVVVLERARGVVRLAVRADGFTTRLQENYQSGSAKLRFPRPEAGAPFTAVLINTAGGLTGGDRLSTAISVCDTATLTVASQTAERIYRRSAGEAGVETTLTVGAGGALDWLPQETILFDRSALRRSLTADLVSSARLLAVESIVLGRAAMGETVRSALLMDTWRIRRDGKLVFADGLRFDGDATAALAGGATGNGATALATVVLVAPDAEAALEGARATLDGCPGEGGVSAWNGVLVARLVAPGGQALRAGVIRLIEALRGLPMPRVWNC